MVNHQPVRILNRVRPCNCGCKGRDSQHAKVFERVVTDIKHLAGPMTVDTGPATFGLAQACAIGHVRLNGAVRQVAFVFDQLEDGRAYLLGWCLIRA